MVHALYPEEDAIKQRPFWQSVNLDVSTVLKFGPGVRKYRFGRSQVDAL